MTPDGLLAKDFLELIKARKRTYTWSEARTMDHVQATLRGHAGRWYHKVQNGILTGSEYTAFTTNFTTGFQPKFKATSEVPDDAVVVEWSEIM